MRAVRINAPLLSLVTIALLSSCGGDGPATQAVSAVSSTLTDPASGAVATARICA